MEIVICKHWGYLLYAMITYDTFTMQIQTWEISDRQNVFVVLTIIASVQSHQPTDMIECLYFT